jgi:YhcH/YjgK/YiaL family protein
MILSNLKNRKELEQLHPLFPVLFDYIEKHDILSAPQGIIEIQGRDLFLNNYSPEPATCDTAPLEVHQKYIDIHFPLSGEEIVGWKHLSGLGESEAPFDAENDFALYAEKPSTYYTVLPGEFYIVYPEDAHAPIIGEGCLRKLIVKVLIDA